MSLKIIGALVGLGYGFLAGFLKYQIIWRGANREGSEVTTKGVYIRMGCSYLADVLILLAIFLARNAIPFDYFWTLLTAAIGLSVSTRLVPMRSIAGRVKEK